MNDTTYHSSNRAVTTGRAHVGPRRIAATAAVAMAALGMATLLGACGAGDDQLDPAAAGSFTSPAPTGTADPQAPPAGGAATNPGNEDAGGGSGSGSGSGSEDGGSGDSGSGNGGDEGGGDGQPGDSRGEPPFFNDFDGEGYFEGSDPRVLVADIFGHALDPDNTDDSQRRVARVEIDWDDGTTTTAQLGGHGAFSGRHEYDFSHAGRTVTVLIVAHAHDGQTASVTLPVQLPSS